MVVFYADPSVRPPRAAVHPDDHFELIFEGHFDGALEAGAAMRFTEDVEGRQEVEISYPKGEVAEGEGRGWVSIYSRRRATS